ncbi:ferredoxin [Paenibacillus larvae subsp. pulvifaciens]|uniref:Ferredoxin n=1 Tax=Paenibacillus larvae subsp. pulvifaciens TaxID=1477 RepID=A0A1V0UX12_9BACL|nr:2Fe-2S iron-sulfur cluster-binding protein [Paenibacillus larvae]ARF69629.1 ferredoxin [Paenibacillus larvae subsp. pulvifaciens]
MVTLKTRAMQKDIEPVPGETLLQLAIRNKMDWGYNCKRGTCARCRCFIQEGAALLEDSTEAEELRLEPEEIEQGYRLACQAVIKDEGRLIAVHKPYFFF